MAAESPKRTFTVEEANALLPTVAPLLERLREAHGAMEARHDEVMESSPTNGGGAAHSEFLAASEEADRTIQQLNALGIVVRDPRTGLIDFPGERDGIEVFLCWRLGEERVAWWHPPETGFAGRQPI